MNLLVFVIFLLVCIIALCADGDGLIEVIMEWSVCVVNTKVITCGRVK